MRIKKQKWTLGLVAIAAVAGFVINGRAQSVDSLLDKLVDKGVITVKEANELREESDKDFTKAYSAKSGLPEWVSALKFNGDVRGRYESFYYDNAAGVDRQRFRYRMRFGVTAQLTDAFEAGFRLTSSEAANGGSGGDPISGNSTFQDNGSKKFVYLDLAYAKWTPVRTADWLGSMTIGKMENPFVFSDLIFDADYTPEGAALQWGYNLTEAHGLKFNGAAFALDELGAQSEDPYLYGGQVRLESTWNKHWSSSAGVAWLAIENEQALANTVGATANPVPDQNKGNTRGASANTSVGALAGALVYDFTPVIADASVTYTMDDFWHYNAPFPIKVGGDFIQNPNAGPDNQGWSAGVLFGKAGKKGLWEIGYRYKYLEADAWYEELVDSDFGAFYQAAPVGGSAGYGAGTNVKGHVIKAAYSPYNPLTLTVTAFFSELINPNPAGSESKTTRIQMDATLKF
ncbi:MAG: putative porin [Verrucomicrobiota bacterium]